MHSVTNCPTKLCISEGGKEDRARNFIESINYHQYQKPMDGRDYGSSIK